MTKATINSEKGLETFTWYTNLFFQGLVGPTFMTNSMQDIYRDWVNEKVNMFMVGPWLRFFVRATVPAMEKNLVSAPTPYHEKPGPAGTTATAGYALTSQVRNQDAAWEFVKFMCSRDNLVEYCGAADYIPPVAGAASMPRYKEDKWMQYFMQALPTAKLIPVHPRRADLDLVIADALQAVWLKKKTAKQSVDDAADQLDKILAEKA
jgi:ABC-type glycerol-3-phosphate transport system substrate-binding protein